ncbi:PAS/PAC sensor signal transduction histidine kinase [Thermus arciformis]|uniref:histidine kinase n=1 Tax=Thermus arciformis TaxID=482827 RepID=A0A1G7F2Q7_9DEIN|nr:ATP-binding protein [Thermus arciformis]SDE70102.1 PAS/PAC sensor signal transduction histidine kinase [Thermus arciformis]
MRLVGQMEVLARFQRALLKDLEPTQILRNLLEVATEEGVERAALFLYHPETRELVGEVASGRGRHYTVSAIALPLYAKGPVQEAFFAEGPLKLREEWLLPVVGEEASFCWADPESRCAERPRATRESRPLVCPSCPRFAAKGVLALEGVPPSLQPLLPLLAQLTALALKNGELFAQRNQALARLSRHVEALAHVSALTREVARALDPNAVLETLARALVERLGFYRATVALVRGESLLGHLTVKGRQVFWTEGKSALHLALASSPDPMARAARERRSLLVPREALPPGVAQGMGPTVAFVPVVAEEAVLGVLAVDHGPGGPPVSEEEVRYLELLAGAAGVAFRNAELYREKTRLSLALAAERTRLSQVLEELPDGVVVLFGERGFANGRAREALGLGAEVALEDLPAALAPALEGGRLELALGGATYSVRGRQVGEARILVLHDITERTRMERALRDQVAFTQALVDVAQEALRQRDLPSLGRAIVDRLLALFAAQEGVLLAESGGKGEVLYSTCALPEELPRPNLLERALGEEAPLGVEALAPEDCALAEALGLKSALVVPFRTQGFRGALLLGYRQGRRFSERLLHRLGQVATLLALVLEKGRFLALLEAEEERLKALLEHSQDVVYVLDQEGFIRFASPSVRTLLGYEPEGYKEAPVKALDFVYPEDRPKAEALLGELLSQPGHTLTGEFRVLHKDGTPIPMEAWGRNLLQDPRVGGVVVDLRDLRPRLEADRVKGEFIAAVSHELRTPLAVIMGLAELLQEEALSPSAQESVELIMESAFRLKTMVDNLLDTSRLEAGRFEISRRPVHLKPLLLDLARSFQGVARLSGVEFRVELEELPLVEVDPDRIVQVVGNLLSNAFKFTPPGGRVTLSARRVGDELFLEVADTGPGIPKEELPRLFQRYARAKNARARGVSGTGLGLFISKHIVEAHGGRIEVESEEGRGSLFRVILPLYGPHPPR